MYTRPYSYRQVARPVSIALCVFVFLFSSLIIHPLQAQNTDQFKADFTKAIKDKNQQKIIELAGVASTNKDINFNSGWKRHVSKAIDMLAPRVDWNTRLQYFKIAEALEISVDVDPEAMNKKQKALSLISSEPREAVGLFNEAIKGHADINDTELWTMIQAATKSGSKMDAFNWINHLSREWMKNNERAFNTFWHKELKPREAPLRLSLITHTIIGGKGKQAIRKIEFPDRYTVVAKGKGFEVTYDLRTGDGVVSGNINTVDDMEGYSTRARLHKSWNKREGQKLYDPRNGQTYIAQTWQNHKILQQPMLSSDAGWHMWGWWHSICEKHALMADSRLYEVWLGPNGTVGGVMWTDGGNTTLKKDPSNLKKGARNVAGGFGAYPAQMLTLINPETQELIYGRVIKGTTPKYTTDPWGRLYLAGVNGNAVLAIVDSSLKRDLQKIPFGSDAERGPRAKAVKARFGVIARHHNILVLGGYTNAPHIQAKNAVQRKNGGDYDGLLIILRLW